ncbi:hypothetical protein M407DRAFT_241961 [Tulasnella calospora MUT 4182]|uniref:STEEP1 domain-containing protein n=1 Tax=Tulasnella calospora MUT 4182 TaxID=1051891 RepID=A0A0C3QH14_9AGAM|nr:hypothetical protein M407DRAFT_241961 [Tulasnella calospora MUT 4182]
MPKIVSRSAVSSSTEAAPTESSTASLKVWYCLCGEFLLVIDKNLKKLPRRKTDGAVMLRCRDTPSSKAAVFKLNVAECDPVLIKRTNGYERQWRYACTRCSLPVAYQTAPHPIKSAPFLYLVWGSMTMIQGKVPQEAWEGEEEVHNAMEE